MSSDAAVAFVQAQRMQNGARAVPTLAPTGADGSDVVIVRRGNPLNDDGSPIVLDGMPKPGEPGYAKAIAIHSADRRRVDEQGHLVLEYDDPQMVSMGETDASSATAPAVAPTAVPASAPAVGGKRVLLTFGPKEGTVAVTVEEDDEVLLSRIVPLEAALAFKPLLSLIAKVKDMTGGQLAEPAVTIEELVGAAS